MTSPRRTPIVLLEASTLLSSTGNGVTTVALPWLVLERTGSPTATGVVAAATALPLLAGSLLAGMLVDTLGQAGPGSGIPSGHAAAGGLLSAAAIGRARRHYVVALRRRIRAVNLGTTGFATSTTTQNALAMSGATR